jgi:Rrf2 family protein
MNVSARFTVSLHILTLLASQPEEALTSEFIAGSVNTNPAFIRRQMAALRKAGLVASQPGTGGGWRLMADPATLTLAEVRRALHEGSPFSMHPQRPNPACTVGRGIQAALLPIYAHAERAMEADLDQTTVGSLLATVSAHK